MNLAGSSSAGNWIGYSASAGAYPSIGQAQGANGATLMVQAGGSENMGTTGAGNLYINGNDCPAATGKLDVKGGNLTVGTGNTANILAFFPDAAPAAKTTLKIQSGGAVTANGIKFGDDAVATRRGPVGGILDSHGHFPKRHGLRHRRDHPRPPFHHARNVHSFWRILRPIG